jgi:hypothetical protein
MSIKEMKRQLIMVMAINVTLGASTMAFLGPFITKWFLVHPEITSSLIASATMLGTIMGLVVAWIKKSPKRLAFMQQWFIPLTIVIDLLTLSFVFMTEHVVYIYIVDTINGALVIATIKAIISYNLKILFQKKALQIVEGSVNFNVMKAGFFGALFALFIGELGFKEIDPKILFGIEFVVFAISHRMQTWTNYRLREITRRKNEIRFQ